MILPKGGERCPDCFRYLCVCEAPAVATRDRLDCYCGRTVSPRWVCAACNGCVDCCSCEADEEALGEAFDRDELGIDPETDQEE